MHRRKPRNVKRHYYLDTSTQHNEELLSCLYLTVVNTTKWRYYSSNKMCNEELIGEWGISNKDNPESSLDIWVKT